MATARIYANEDVVIIKAPFRADFVDDLKALLPRHKRYYNPEDKTWETHPEYLEEVIALARRYYTNVLVDEFEAFEAQEEEPRSKGKAEPKAEPKNGDPWMAIKQFMTKDAYKSLFRLLAKEHHPDKGGDGEKMKAVNTLFEKLGVK